MKAVKCLFVIIFFIFLFSCGTTGPVVELEEETGPVKRIEKVSIDLPVKINTLFSDGMLDTYKLISYEYGSDRVLLEEEYDSTGAKLEKIECQYSDDMLVKKTRYDRSGSLESYHSYKYDKGLLLEDVLFDSSEKMQNKSVYKYDENYNRIKWDIVNRDGAVLGSNEYVYENGALARINTLTPDGVLEKYTVNNYGTDGMLLKEEFYNATNELEKITEYVYENSKLKTVIYRKANGAAQRKETYEYKDGIKKINYLDNKGRVIEIEEYVLEKREVERVVWE